MNKYNYVKNETSNRRISNYDFKANTSIVYDNEQIKISTEMNIDGVYNVLYLFSDGSSKIYFEFNR